MKLILFLILAELMTSTTYAIDKKTCKYGERPVCGQPPMPECMKGLVCIQMMPAHKNYANRCDMESDRAELVSEGKCIDPLIDNVRVTY